MNVFIWCLMSQTTKYFTCEVMQVSVLIFLDTCSTAHNNHCNYIWRLCGRTTWLCHSTSCRSTVQLSRDEQPQLWQCYCYGPIQAVAVGPIQAVAVIAGEHKCQCRWRFQLKTKCLFIQSELTYVYYDNIPIWQCILQFWFAFWMWSNSLKLWALSFNFTWSRKLPYLLCKAFQLKTI